MTRSGMPKRWIGIRSCNWQQWTQYRQTPSCRHAQSWALVVTANLIEAANPETASVIGVLGVPSTRSGWLRPALLNQARARWSFSLLVNRSSLLAPWPKPVTTSLRA